LYPQNTPSGLKTCRLLLKRPTGYTFMMQGDDPRFDKNMNYHKRFTRTWDDPVIDENLDIR